MKVLGITSHFFHASLWSLGIDIKCLSLPDFSSMKPAALVQNAKSFRSSLSKKLCRRDVFPRRSGKHSLSMKRRASARTTSLLMFAGRSIKRRKRSSRWRFAHGYIVQISALSWRIQSFWPARNGRFFYAFCSHFCGVSIQSLRWSIYPSVFLDMKSTGLRSSAIFLWYLMQTIALLWLVQMELVSPRSWK